MVMNKKGQLIIMRIMIGIIVFIMVMIMIQPTKQAIEYSTNTSANLNCSSSSLTSTQEATCIVVDFSLFYMIGLAICAGMAYIAGKKHLSGVITAIVVFVVTSILIEPLKDFIVYARDASHLNCVDATISVASRLSCLVIDLWLFWFVLTAISAAITFIFIKKVIPKFTGEG